MSNDTPLFYFDIDGNLTIECCGKSISPQDYASFTGKQIPDKYLNLMKKFITTDYELTDNDCDYSQKIYDEVKTNLLTAAKEKCSDKVCSDKVCHTDK